MKRKLETPNLGWGFFVFVVLILGVLWGKHIWLLVSNQERKIVNQIEKYEEITETVIPKRGQIFSDNGELLATTVLGYRLLFDAYSGYASLKGVTDSLKVEQKNREFEEYVNQLIPVLAPIINQPVDKLFKKIKGKSREKIKTIELAQEVSLKMKEQIMKIDILTEGEGKKYKGQNKTGLIFKEVHSAREYPFGKISERLVGKYKPEEKSPGIEGAFDEYLKGKEGKEKRIIVDKTGSRTLEVIEKVKHGYDVYATIDVNMQSVAYEVLQKQLKKYKANHGCAIVMEVKTGKIKAISNLGLGKNGEYYERLNYAIGRAYSPGSTFKPVSVIALLEETRVDTSTIVNAKSEMVFHKRKISNSGGKNYGNISFAKSIVVSSNTGIAQLVDKHLNKKIFTDKMTQFNLNKPLGLPFEGEAEPVFKNLSEVKFQGEYIWNAYGYGIELTPLQMLSFYNTIANDGVMVKPRLVSKVMDGENIVYNFEREVVAENLWSVQTNNKVKKILENVVKDKSGTARRFYMKDLPIAGKTGTAQIESKKGKYISSFVGYFPANKPEYSCIVLLYETSKEYGYYGAGVAGEAVKEIAQRIYKEPAKEIQVVLQKSKEDQQQSKKSFVWNDKTIMPNLIGFHPMEVIPELENAGLFVKISGGSGKIYKQSVPAGKKITSVKEITLTLK